ncbi:hypothetical protein FHG64_04980 [Antarcticibacterium flavum]|uniref:Lysoplasmalogenase n=1 Tax=Antarcticibacterium flavum TaxID=2058175 RepID=A0A5B7X261_9FLAO|nr:MULTISPECIES: hypothetical protein [Antarcticibacterium]MCM4160720.1 hypothetical protein [Antarcticibacterium sp. W02-3]QCY68802.1 hypothetical protein FHG64_04980 [Antarcticibacterium flavum]
MYVKKLLPGFGGLFLLLVNILIITYYGLEESRWIRAFSVGLFVAYFVVFATGRKFNLLPALLFLLIADVLLIYYENPILRYINFLVGILAYMFLAAHIFPYIRNLKVMMLQKLLFTIVLIINISLLFFLLEMAGPGIQGSLHQILFIAYGLSMIFLVVFAFSFNHRFSNRASFFFIVAVLALIFSDISSFIAYYLEVWEFYYPDRLFYIAGLAALVKFGSIDKKEGMLQKPDYL